eukprot:Skav216403  [mRNA]  locus=scaffold457:351586:353202:+ [translate_table: standard]
MHQRSFARMKLLTQLQQQLLSKGSLLHPLEVDLLQLPGAHYHHAEGIHHFRAGEAVYVPADDLTDPAPATTFAHLDATTVLSRQIAEHLGGSGVRRWLGIYPAVDPLDSTSRMLDPSIVGQRHWAQGGTN